MSTPFAQTTRALRADRFQRSAWTLALTVTFLAAWVGWLVGARVTVVVRSDAARLEATAHAVQASLPGRVATVNVLLGQEVEIGTPLVTLDAEDARLEKAEALTRQAALEARLAALRSEQAGAQEALRQADRAHLAGLDGERAQGTEIESTADMASAEATRLHRLFEEEIVSRAVYERAAAEAEQRRAAADAHRQRLRQSGFLRRQDVGDRQVRLDQLAGEIAALQGERETTAAIIARLQHEMARRLVRAPVAGRVADLAPLRAGAFVEAGDRIGAIVPVGTVRAVAHLPASDATGRIRPGQPAQMRLDGFSWTQYGAVAATVERVATDAAAGRVRVELQIEPASVPRVPLQHGLTGTLEIEIERAAPAALVLRHAGWLVSS